MTENMGNEYLISLGAPVKVISILTKVLERAASVIPLAATVSVMVVPARLESESVMGSTSVSPVMILER